MSTEWTFVLPNNLLFAVHFKDLNTFARMVRSNDRVAVGQALATARIVKGLEVRKVIVGNLPDYLSNGIELSSLVSVSQIDQSVPIIQLYGGERPILSFASAQFV